MRAYGANVIMSIADSILTRNTAVGAYVNVPYLLLASGLGGPIVMIHVPVSVYPTMCDCCYAGGSGGGIWANLVGPRSAMSFANCSITHNLCGARFLHVCKAICPCTVTLIKGTDIRYCFIRYCFALIVSLGYFWSGGGLYGFTIGVGSAFSMVDCTVSNNSGGACSVLCLQSLLRTEFTC